MAKRKRTNETDQAIKILSGIANHLGGTVSRDAVGPYLPAVNHTDMVWRVDLENATVGITRPQRALMTASGHAATNISTIFHSSFITTVPLFGNYPQKPSPTQETIASIDLSDPRSLEPESLRQVLHQVTHPGLPHKR